MYMDMKNTMDSTITKGDLIFFKPEYSEDPWADRVALVVSLDLPYATLLCRGETLKAPLWTLEKVKQL